MQEVKPVGRQDQVQVVVATLILLKDYVTTMHLRLVILKGDQVGSRAIHRLDVPIQVVVLKLYK